MRMAELARKSGVSRETIHYYLREGLLPKPTKGGRTVAYYDDEHLERLRLIRRLRDEKYLPLAVIRKMVGAETSFAHESDVETLADVLSIDSGLGRSPPAAEAVDDETTRVALRLGLLGRASAGPADPAHARVLAAVAEALALEGDARQLTLADMQACARELEGLVDIEASLFFDLLVREGDVGRAVSALRAGRGAVARYISAFRDLMLRAIVDEIFDAIETSRTGVETVFLRLSDAKRKQLGVPERRSELRERARRGDAAAANDLVWHVFVVGPARELAKLPQKVRELLRPRARLLVELVSGDRRTGPDVSLLESIAGKAGPFPLGDVLLEEAKLARLARAGPSDEGVLDQIVPILHRVTGVQPELDADPLASACAFYRRGQLGLWLPRVLGRHASALSDLDRSLEVVLSAPGRIHPAARARLEGNARLAVGRELFTVDRQRALDHLERARGLDPQGPIGEAVREVLRTG